MTPAEYMRKLINELNQSLIEETKPSTLMEGAFDVENTYEPGTNKSAAEYANQLWFHGTDEDFDEFRLGVRRMGDGRALWFSENPKMSGYYGPNQYKVKLHFHNPLIVGEAEYEEQSKNEWISLARLQENDALIIQDIVDGDTISTICCVFDPSIVEILGKDIYKDEDETGLTEGPNDSPLTFQGTKKWQNEKDFFKKWFSRPFLTHEK